MGAAPSGLTIVRMQSMGGAAAPCTHHESVSPRATDTWCNNNCFYNPPNCAPPTWVRAIGRVPRTVSVRLVRCEVRPRLAPEEFGAAHRKVVREPLVRLARESCSRCNNKIQAYST
eukprot:scaffold95146_cov54-Phaeocystis_antarctica.AAC.1